MSEADLNEREITEIKRPELTSTQLAVQASDARKNALQQEMDLLTEMIGKISNIDGNDWLVVENVPAIAYLLTKMPLAKGATLSYPEAMAMAFTCVSEKANPWTGEVYRTGPFRFGTNVQQKINKLRREGIQVGVPSFDPQFRDWPAGKKLTRYDYVTKREISFDMPREPGMTCNLPLGKSLVSQTVWLIENFVSSNDNWYSRMDHMLQVRALGRCVTFGGGEGVSDNVGVDTPEDTKEVEVSEIPKIKVSK
jgi:hypothetical protein